MPVVRRDDQDRFVPTAVLLDPVRDRFHSVVAAVDRADGGVQVVVVIGLIKGVRDWTDQRSQDSFIATRSAEDPGKWEKLLPILERACGRRSLEHLVFHISAAPHDIKKQLVPWLVDFFYDKKTKTPTAILKGICQAPTEETVDFVREAIVGKDELGKALLVWVDSRQSGKRRAFLKSRLLGIDVPDDGDEGE